MRNGKGCSRHYIHQDVLDQVEVKDCDERSIVMCERNREKSCFMTVEK